MAGKNSDDIIKPLPFAELAEPAFYGLAGEIARMFEPSSESDQASLVMQFLTLCGNLFGPSPHFMVSETRHGANLFVQIVGATGSGSRKGSGLNQVAKPVEKVAEKLSRGWLVRSGLTTGEGLIHAFRDDLETWVTDKKTGQPVRQIEKGVDEKRGMYIETEFGGVFAVSGREGNNLSATVRKAWDGSKLGTGGKKSPETATGAHISIIAHITQEELLEKIPEGDLSNGNANRFLYCFARRVKVIASPPPVPTEEKKAVLEKLEAAFEFASTAGRITRSPEAEYFWREFLYKSLTTPWGGLVGKLLARADAQVMRLAMLYALLDCKKQIALVHLKAAVAVWEYSERSVQFIFKGKTGMSVADVILRALREAGDAGLTETQQSGLFGRACPAALLSQARDFLSKNNFATVIKEKNAAGGAPIKRWRATDKLDDPLVESRHLRLFDSNPPSTSRLKKLEASQKREEQIRTATEDMEQKFVGDRFAKLRGNETQGEETLRKIADEEEAA